MSITYEKMTKRDYPFVKELITQAWFSEYTFSKNVINLYAKGYLYMYLSELDYCVVARDGEKTIGFLFGRNGKINFFKKLYYKMRLFFVGVSLLFTRAGRRGLKITRITNKSNKILYKNANTDIKSELVLFIVDEKYRGNSIGSKLEKDFCDFLTKQGKKGVYLYTDTYSNFEYYEHRNYSRRGEIEVDFKIKGEVENPSPKYYIYIKNLGEKDANNK